MKAAPIDSPFVPASCYDPPRWLRRLGCFEISRGLVRFRWGEVSPRFGVGFELCLFEQGWSLMLHPGWGRWFLNLPKFLSRREPHEMMESWGFTWHLPEGDTHLHWGQRTKILWSPWRWEMASWVVLKKDGTWRKHETGDYDRPDDLHVEEHPYHYLLSSGEVQHVTASLIVERTVRKPALLRRLPWPRRTFHGIDIRFSDEVGGRAGSWKGGCIGCGYTMKRGERPVDALRRMQRERRFR